MNALSCISRRNLQQFRRFHRCLAHTTAVQPAAQPAAATEPHTEEESSGEAGIGPKISPRIQALANDIVSLNLIEVAQLSDVLKKRLNLPDAPLMSFAPGPAAAAGAANEDEQEPQQETVQTAFTVTLTEIDATKKINIIKLVKSLIPDCNLVQAKKFVESLPGKLKEDIPKQEAEEILKQIEEAGAKGKIQ